MEKVNKNKLINIRLADLADVDEILKLNKKHTVSSAEAIDQQHGSLFCENYKQEDIVKIINANELGVALQDNRLVGYYINDNHSELLEKYHKAIQYCKGNGLIPINARVSARTQIVVEKDFQKMGIPTAMLNFLKPMLRSKFDFLFSFVLKENPKLIAHQRAGWKIIFENESEYYCIYNLLLD